MPSPMSAGLHVRVSPLVFRSGQCPSSCCSSAWRAVKSAGAPRLVGGRSLPRQLRSRGHVPVAESTEALAARLFRADNRMGVAGTLHRISAIRDRTHAVVGLTYRVGRAMPGALRRPCVALPAAAHVLRYPRGRPPTRVAYQADQHLALSGT